MKSLRSSRTPGKSASSINSKGVWVDSKTFRQYNLPGEGRVYFDSQLELSAFHRLRELCPYEVIRQHSVRLVEPPNLEVWKADFYIPETKTVIEVKGDWINNKSQKAAKHLFRLQMNLVLSKGYKLILLGSENDKIAKLSIPVIGIKELNGRHFFTP